MAEPLTILVVEDDAAVRGLVVQIAKRTMPQATIATAGNGLDALSHIAEAGADLVITDFQMPGMGGAELIRKMRKQRLDTPVIMVSGSADAHAAAEAAGVSAFVEKTKMGSDLPPAIHSALLAA